MTALLPFLRRVRWVLSDDAYLHADPVVWNERREEVLDELEVIEATLREDEQKRLALGLIGPVDPWEAH